MCSNVETFTSTFENRSQKHEFIHCFINQASSLRYTYKYLGSCVEELMLSSCITWRIALYERSQADC